MFTRLLLDMGPERCHQFGITNSLRLGYDGGRKRTIFETWGPRIAGIGHYRDADPRR